MRGGNEATVIHRDTMKVGKNGDGFQSGTRQKREISC